MYISCYLKYIVKIDSNLSDHYVSIKSLKEQLIPHLVLTLYAFTCMDEPFYHLVLTIGFYLHITLKVLTFCTLCFLGAKVGMTRRGKQYQSFNFASKLIFSSSLLTFMPNGLKCVNFWIF